MKIIVIFLAIFLNFSYCFAGIKQGSAIKGITPVDVYLNLTKKGFKTRWNQYYKEYNDWLLEKSSASNSKQLEVFGKNGGDVYKVLEFTALKIHYLQVVLYS